MLSTSIHTCTCCIYTCTCTHHYLLIFEFKHYTRPSHLLTSTSSITKKINNYRWMDACPCSLIPYNGRTVNRSLSSRSSWSCCCDAMTVHVVESGSSATPIKHSMMVDDCWKLQPWFVTLIGRITRYILHYSCSNTKPLTMSCYRLNYFGKLRV